MLSSAKLSRKPVRFSVTKGAVGSNLMLDFSSFSEILFDLYPGRNSIISSYMNIVRSSIKDASSDKFFEVPKVIINQIICPDHAFVSTENVVHFTDEWKEFS